MKFDTTVEINDLYGKTIPWNGQPMTLGIACSEALLGMEPREQLPAEQKVMRFELARKIVQAEQFVDLNVEDTKLIKELVGKMFFPVIVGRVFELLDPPPCQEPRAEVE